MSISFQRSFKSCHHHVTANDLQSGILACDYNGMRTGLMYGHTQAIVLRGPNGHVVFGDHRIIDISDSYKPIWEQADIAMFVEMVAMSGFPLRVFYEIFELSITDMDAALEKYQWLKDQMGSDIEVFEKLQ